MLETHAAPLRAIPHMSFHANFQATTQWSVVANRLPSGTAAVEPPVRELVSQERLWVSFLPEACTLLPLQHWSRL